MSDVRLDRAQGHLLAVQKHWTEAYSALLEAGRSDLIAQAESVGGQISDLIKSIEREREPVEHH